MDPSPPPPPHADHNRLVFFEHATAVRLGGESALRDFSWTLRDGETWAVVGPVGSGKTTLAEVILGRHRIQSGAAGWPFLDALRANGHPVGWPADVIHQVSFKEESWLFSYGRHYYQQRFNFIEPHDDLTLDAFLRSGTSASDDAILQAARQMGVGDLLPLSFIKLSNGQARRARIARALLARPELLILDEPFLGLDTAGRKDLMDLLGALIQRRARVLLITRPDAVPAWVTHVLELDCLSVAWQGPRSQLEAGSCELGASALNSKLQAPSSELKSPTTEPVIELRNVNVAYGDRPILRNICWTVRSGERWAVLGPNGSGKTTLLSLLCGDHPQAYANDIRLFGRRRGSGESIWEIKRRIGLVSPELHLYYSESLTAAEVAATGFFDVLAYRPTTPEQDTTVRELFDHFGIATLGNRPFTRLSTGEQRLVLLIRALVKQPPLLVLDEPFQGLDAKAIDRAREWLEQRLRPDQTLLFVSHIPEEIPRTVDRVLRLEDGWVAS
jgi:molybdate transport system ATP-binding protein